MSLLATENSSVRKTVMPFEPESLFGEMVVLVRSVWKACAIRRTIGASLARWIRPFESLVFRRARTNAAQ